MVSAKPHIINPVDSYAASQDHMAATNYSQKDNDCLSSSLSAFSAVRKDDDDDCSRSDSKERSNAWHFHSQQYQQKSQQTPIDSSALNEMVINLFQESQIQDSQIVPAFERDGLNDPLRVVKRGRKLPKNA